QIDNFCAERVRQSEGSMQVKQDGFEQKNRELKKSPSMSPTITEHRPPGLDIDDQKEQCPPDRRPVDAHSIARVNHVTQALEQLRHAQAENDGENDCEITELIHAAAISAITRQDFCRQWIALLYGQACRLHHPRFFAADTAASTGTD